MTTPSVHLFEHHDEAYHVWRAGGVRGATVVHVDAHHDLSWLDDALHLHIGNYLCQAIKDGLVRAIFWVVPDGALRARRARTEIRRQLGELCRAYGQSSRRIARDRDGFSLDLRGCRVVVCELDALPALDRTVDDVLLDVDIDYLLTPGARLWEEYPPQDVWLRPAACAERLRQVHLGASIVTIAYSVEGGYTPLWAKFFGDELAAVFRGSPVAAFAHLHDAHRLAGLGRLDEAVTASGRAAATLVNPAPAEWARAHVERRRGDMASARTAYRAALAHDPSYATAYNCGGPTALDRGHLDAAARAFAAQLALDDEDGRAALGLAQVAMRRRRWADAEAHARVALSRGLDSTDAHRVLGLALQQLGRPDDAARAFQCCLRRSLGGGAPGVVLSSRRSSRLPTDTEHGRVYAALATLDARIGRVRDAIAAFRLAISAGYGLPSVRLRLAILYARERRWRAAAREVAAACEAGAASAVRAGRRARVAVALHLEALNA